MVTHIFSGQDLEKFKNGTLKTKWSHPYNYDPITQFIRHDYPEDERVDSPYSDRMFRWQPERFRELQKKHFGNQGDYWDGRSPEAIEGFLKDYYNSPDLLLVKVVEYCNQSTGYPVWQFFFIGRDTSNDA